jgi:hypothetical protein
MSIRSSAFCRVELTGADAKKFHNQVTYGRAKPAVARGVVLSKSLKETGSVRVKLKV